MFSLTQPDRKMGADGHDSENKLVAESTAPDCLEDWGSQESWRIQARLA